jgi:hypothetical protein
MKIVSATAGWLHRLLTGSDNHTPDVVRILGALMGIQFIVNSGYALVHLQQAWDPSAYGTGAGLVLAAIGAALGMKAFAEPR